VAEQGDKNQLGLSGMLSLKPLPLGTPLHRLRYGDMAKHIQRMLEEGGNDLKMCLLELGITVIEVPQTPEELGRLFTTNPVIYALVHQIVAHRE